MQHQKKSNQNQTCLSEHWLTSHLTFAVIGDSSWPMVSLPEICVKVWVEVAVAASCCRPCWAHMAPAVCRNNSLLAFCRTLFSHTHTHTYTFDTSSTKIVFYYLIWASLNSSEEVVAIDTRIRSANGLKLSTAFPHKKSFQSKRFSSPLHERNITFFTHIQIHPDKFFMTRARRKN
jgi:hypothetical protein